MGLKEIRAAGPGTGLAVAVGGACIVVSSFVSSLSAMLVAIVLGVILRNTIAVPTWAGPGIAFSSKTLLRWGVVLLGFQLSIPVILSLGPGVLVVVLVAVTGTFLATLLAGRMMKVDKDLTTLVAAGFSICGAAAIAGIQGIVKARDEAVAAAVALVVLFGTLMIPVTAGLVALVQPSQIEAGVLIGGTVHEVAQVVAAAGIAGGEGLLAIAVPVKLSRVLLLAPMAAGVSLTSREPGPRPHGKRPALIPAFVLGFLVAAGIATTGVLPEGLLLVLSKVQQLLLASAMFALGTGVHLRSLVKLGFKPVALGAIATTTICLIVAAGIVLLVG